MTTEAFPTGFYLDRSTTFRHHPTESIDMMSDGAPRSRTLTTSRYVTISCEFSFLTADEKATLESFLLSNQANTITWTIDGVDYSGRFVGGHSVTMTGPLFSVSFTYYAMIV